MQPQTDRKFVVVLLDSSIVPDSTDCEIESDVLGRFCTLRHAFVDTNPEIVEASRHADAIILWHHVELSAGVLEQMRRCRIIVRNGVGFDNVDVLAAARLGIPVCNIPDYGTEEVADHAMALALCVARRIIPSWQDVRAGRWNWRSACPITRTRELRFGVLGCGRIGTAVLLRARAFGYKVAFFDPYRPDGIEKSLGCSRFSGLSEFLASSDILSLHAPLTPETRHLIRSETITQLPGGAIIVNTARGPLVDEVALADALESGHIAGAGLDVVSKEPMPNARLLNHPNCIVTPHSAFYSEQSWSEMRSKSASAVLNVLQGGAPRNVVNEPVTARAQP